MRLNYELLQFHNWSILRVRDVLSRNKNLGTQMILSENKKIITWIHIVIYFAKFNGTIPWVLVILCLQVLRKFGTSGPLHFGWDGPRSTVVMPSTWNKGMLEADTPTTYPFCSVKMHGVHQQEVHITQAGMSHWASQLHWILLWERRYNDTAHTLAKIC